MCLYEKQIVDRHSLAGPVRFIIRIVSNSSVDINIVIYILFQFPFHILLLYMNCVWVAREPQSCMTFACNVWEKKIGIAYVLSLFLFSLHVCRLRVNDLPIGRTMWVCVCVCSVYELLLLAMRPFPSYLNVNAGRSIRARNKFWRF